MHQQLFNSEMGLRLLINKACSFEYAGLWARPQVNEAVAMLSGKTGQGRVGESARVVSQTRYNR